MDAVDLEDDHVTGPADWLQPPRAGGLSAASGQAAHSSTQAQSQDFRPGAGASPVWGAGGVGVKLTDKDWTGVAPAGTSPTASTSTQLAGGREGMSFGRSHSQSFTDADGGAVGSLGVGGSYRTDGTVGASGSWTGAGGVSQSVRGSSKIADGSGRLALNYGVASRRTAGQPQYSAGVGGTVGWTAGQPALQRDGTYLVEYSFDVGASAALGSASERELDSGAKLGVGGKMQAAGARKTGGHRRFATLDQAQAFRDQLSPALAGGAPSSAASALDLAAGEMRETETSGSVGASVTGSLEALQVGVAGGYGQGSSVQVERLSGDQVRVTLGGSQSGSLAGRGGVMGMSLEASKSGTAHQDTSWILDLSTAEGSAAYTDIVRSGQPPSADGPGVQEVGSTVGSVQRDGFGVDLVGNSVKVGSQRAELTRRDAEGNTTRERSGAAFDDISFATASWQATQGVAAGVVTDRDGAEVTNYVEGRANAEGGDVQGNYGTLGAFAGTSSTQARGVVPTPGEIQAETVFGGHSLDRLVAAVQDPDFDSSKLKTKLSPAGLAMVEALQQAGSDREAQTRAVEQHGTGGTTAMSDVRAILGRGDTYVHVEQSPVWIGRDGHEEVEGRLAQVERRLEKDLMTPTDASFSARETAEEQTVRLLQLEDRGRFQDIPERLRAEEVRRTRALIKRARDILERVGGGDSGQAVGDAHGLTALFDEVKVAYYQAHVAREEHGAVGFAYENSLRGRVGEQGIWGFGRGPAADAYDAADAQFELGEAKRREAVDSYANVLELGRQGVSAADQQVHADPVRILLIDAVVVFKDSEGGYRSIMSQWGR